MNKNLTEIIFILDRSGSMAHLESDTIGGYNSLLKKQRDEIGEAAVTTVLFDDKFEIIHDNADVTKVSPLTDKEYYARGTTALLDSIGKTISHVMNRHRLAPESLIPHKTLVVIITDGYENASCEYNLRDIKAIINRQQKEYNWEFLFLGANIDAIAAAGDIGIAPDRAATYQADSKGTSMNFEAVDCVVSSVRASRPVTKAWKSAIEKRNK